MAEIQRSQTEEMDSSGAHTEGDTMKPGSVQGGLLSGGGCTGDRRHLSCHVTRRGELTPVYGAH